MLQLINRHALQEWTAYFFRDRNFSLSKKSLVLFIICFTLCSLSFSQNNTSFIIPDSLETTSYEALRSGFSRDKNDTISRYIYANSYLAKAKKASDSLEIAKGYELLGFLNAHDQEKSFAFYDKAIEASKNLQNPRYPAILYTYKGAILSTAGDYQEALDNHLKAITYAESNNNTELLYVNKHNIGLLKRYLELYDEALQIFKECYRYELNNPNRDEVDFMYTHFSLADVYAETKQLDSAMKYNTRGYSLAQNLQDDATADMFLLNRGIIFFHQKKYEQAINYINSSINMLDDSVEKRIIVNGFYHVAKAYDSLQNTEKAINYYKKADSIFTANPTNISSNILETYKALYTYYKAQNDKPNEMLYIEKALLASDINNKGYRNLSSKMIKTFDRRKLLEKQEELNQTLDQKEKKYTLVKLIALLLLVICIVGMIAFYSKQRKLKKRFMVFVEKHEEAKAPKPKENLSDSEEVKAIGLADDVIEHILGLLHTFETNNDFLAADITLPKLSKRFKTNSAYLSKVINTYKNQKFAGYLNNLRIEYTINKLRKEKLFRLYTIKAIALEVGFNNSQSFARAFKRKTNMQPSDFIKQLENAEK